jgi:hypothetical protein
MMQRREQIILGVLLATVVTWQGGGWVASAVLDPFQTRSDNLARLKKSVKEKEEQELMLVRARKSLAEAKSISLPPDPGKQKRPDALNAQRLYLEWVTDLAQLCEIEDPKVTPDQRTVKGNDFVTVAVKLEMDARYEQLVRFLDLFYRTNLLHRVTSLHVSTKEFEGDPFLRVTLQAEGLALIGAPPRRTLFPQTSLTAAISEDDTTLQVADLEGFPKKPGFRIQIKNEFLNVTEMDGQTWTVVRGVDRTVPASHSDKTQIELVPLKADQPDRSLEEFTGLIATNIFVKPAPPYKLKLAPLADKPFVRGKSIEFTIGALGYDTLKGRPEFSLSGTPPADLKLDKSGKLTWKPGPDVKADKYPVNIEVRHPSAPDGCLKETITIRLKEGVAAPKLVVAKPPVVYLNRDWSYRPEIAAGDAPLTQFRWKLGSQSPEGLTIDEKSGELKWTPGDTIPPGETIVPLVVTDSDTPPQSTTLSLKLDVQDDEAEFTRLDTIFIVGPKKLAFFFDASKNKRTELHEGDEFTVGDLTGTVKQIRQKQIVVEIGKREVRLRTGQSLREALTAVVKRDENSPTR